MAAPANSGESGMATEDFCSTLSPLLSPRWSQLCLTPSPPRSFLSSSSSMVMQYQGSNQSIDDPPQNQEDDHIVDPAPYLAGDSALLQQQQHLRKNWSEASLDWRPRGGGIMTMINQGFEESNMGFVESMEMKTCFYFPPSSPTYFPLYPPMPSAFFVSSNIQEDISLAFSYQHILEDKSGASHVFYGEEARDIIQLLLKNDFKSYLKNKFDDLDQIAREADVLPDDMESLMDDVLDADDNEMEGTLRRINWLEQKDEDNVDQAVIELVCVVQQLIQNRGGELDVILGGGVFTLNGLELRDCQDPPTTPETLLICRAKLSIRVLLGHDGQWEAKVRIRYNSLNIGSFTTVEDAMSAYEFVIRWSGRADLTGCPGLFKNENRSKLLLRLPLPAQVVNLVEDFGLVCSNAMGNDEIEAVGTGSQGTEECVMAYQIGLNSGCLGKRKSMEQNSGGERRNKKTNGVRTTIPLEDILQTKGMRLKDAANHLEVNITELKSSCRDYGIQRWPPRNEHKLIRQSLPNEIPVVVDQDGFPQLTSHNGPSVHAFTTTVDTNRVDREILMPQFLPTAQQENPDVVFGNDVAEAIGIGSEGTGEGLMEEGQLNSRCSGKKGKRKVNTPGGERGNNITTGVKIAITMEDILKVKGMPLNDAAKRLEVSQSTLKRACREYGIKRWPPRKEHELISQTHPNKSPTVEHELVSQTHPDEFPSVEHELISQTCPNESHAVEHELINQTHPNESPVIEHELISQTHPNESLVVVADQEQTPQLNLDTFLPSNQVSTTIDTKSVKLKARYEGKTITFRLSLPLRKVELEQEVKKRLQLEAGTYNISYKDEDDDLVLIACDDDLEECISSSTPLGSRCHELFLNLGT